MRLIRTWCSWRLLQFANTLMTLALAIDPAIRPKPSDRLERAGLLPRR